MQRLVVFCDESIEKGKYYSNFFGAIMVKEADLVRVNNILETKLKSLNLGKEVKFTRITTSYQTKYQELMVEFFRLVKSGELKVRIMFTQNLDLPQLTPEQRKRNKYFVLYYQLIKHAFGWQYMPDPTPYLLQLNFDVFAHTKGDIAEFKRYLVGLSNQPELSSKGLIIYERNIAEVDSSKHAILQCLDIVMGSMQFRLNNGHKNKEPGSRFISKRAKAKYAVYKTIHSEILKLYENYQFNIGNNTKYQMPEAGNEPKASRWYLPYSHWRFTPKQSARNSDYSSKNKKRRGSARPT